MATFKVYTEEQQARLGVDEKGTAVPGGAGVAPPAETAETATTPQSSGLMSDGACRDNRPAWVRNGTEPPAGVKNMGTWEMAFYTEEQQARLGVDPDGNPVVPKAPDTSDKAPKTSPDEASDAEQPKLCCGPRICGGKDLRPDWMKHGTEPPVGRKDMGTWVMAVFSEEQQSRLGVDELGQPRAESGGGADAAAEKATVTAPPPDDAALVCKDVRPLWVKYQTEPPAGSQDMGTWSMAVYTEEQQARLGVDEKGNPKPKPTQ